MGFAVAVDIRQSRLLSVSTGQPTQQMIEAAILHHYDNDVVDPRIFRSWKNSLRLWIDAARNARNCRRRRNTRDASEKISSVDGHVLLQREQSDGAGYNLDANQRE